MLKILTYIKNNRCLIFLLLLIGNIVFFALTSYLLDFRYEENDDVMMCMIANGNYFGYPDFHLVFENALLGYFLSSLYRLSVSIEWYSLFFSIVHIVAITIIVYQIIQKNKNNRKLLFFFLLCLYVLWSVTIQSFQFTTTAGWLCVAGCVLVLDEKKSVILGGVIAILVSALIRYEASLLVLLLFCPLTLIIFKNKWIKYLRIVVAFALVLLAVYVDNFFYNTPEWQSYYTYNFIRGEIEDNLNLEELKQNEIRDIGIEEVDYEMFCNFIPDPKVVTIPVLNRIHNKVKSIPIGQKVLNAKQLIKYRIPLALLILLSILMICLVNTRIDMFVIGLWCCMCIALLTYLSFDFPLKNRVFLSALSAMVTFYALIPQSHADKSWKFVAIGMCLLGLSAKYGYQSIKVYESQKEKKYYWQEQRTLLQSVPVDAYLVTLSPMYIEELSPFHINVFHTKLYPIGWLTTIPLNEKLGRAHVDWISSNVYIFISRENSIDKIVNYLKYRYNVSVCVETIAQSERYEVVQFKDDGH